MKIEIQIANGAASFTANEEDTIEQAIALIKNPDVISVKITKQNSTEYEECDGTGCDLCPFPRCEDAPKDLTKAQMRKMEGEIVTIVLDDSVIPVKIVIKDNDVWVENSFGTSTTYDDVKRNGGKFFEKKKNKS